MAVVKAAADAPVQLDQSIDGFGAAVARSVGVEVAEEPQVSAGLLLVREGGFEPAATHARPA